MALAIGVNLEEILAFGQAAHDTLEGALAGNRGERVGDVVTVQ